MKINIAELAESLFWSGGRYLDLDSGELISKILIDHGDRLMPEHAQLLPSYSTAPIYQQYLREMLPKTGLEDTIHLDLYPEFSLNSKTKKQQHFIDEAYHFVTGAKWDRYEEQHEQSKSTNISDYDPSFQPYYEYEAAFKQRIAIKWCEEYGHEWY